MPISKLYFKIFDKAGKEVFEKLANFRRIGALGGGTAISLQLGKRYSYDFDVFVLKPLAPNLLSKAIESFGKNMVKLADSSDELSFLTEQKLKVSFIYFPFSPLHPLVKTESIYLYNLEDLASNKAYVIGRRGEYRDYVDMFFLLKSGLRLKRIIKEAEKRFAGAFSERLFLEQLVYFGDLKDFEIDFLKEQYSPGQIQKFLQFEVKNYYRP